MGVATSSARYMYLDTRRNELEYKIQQTNEAKMNLANATSEMMTVSSDLDPDSPAVKKLEERKNRLYLLDKKLDQNLQRYKMELQMIEGEINSCKSLLDKNIQRTYS